MEQHTPSPDPMPKQERIIKREGAPRKFKSPIFLKGALRNSADLVNTAAPPVRWIVEDFLPATIFGLLVAPGGTGKTWWVYRLLCDLAAGADFLGRKVERPCRVLLVYGEQDEAAHHRRLEATMPGR